MHILALKSKTYFSHLKELMSKTINNRRVCVIIRILTLLYLGVSQPHLTAQENLNHYFELC